jgi:tRNA wybutosine-synthesizing protein 1
LELEKSGVPFSSLDYIEKTPDWAVFGSEERGFDPQELRFKKQRNHTQYATTGC